MGMGRGNTDGKMHTDIYTYDRFLLISVYQINSQCFGERKRERWGVDQLVMEKIN